MQIGNSQQGLYAAILFQGRGHQESYLKRFDNLDPSGQEALKQIYRLAHKSGGGGQHIIQTAVAALKYPLIMQFARENVMLRVALNLARKNQDAAEIAKVEEALEDFHVALDAFNHRISLAEAEDKRRQGDGDAQKTCARTSPDTPRLADRSAEDMEAVRLFVRSIRKYVTRFRERKSQPPQAR
jgi:hypothetical protein